MFSCSICSFHTKFQANWLKNSQVILIFSFRRVGWVADQFGQLACSNANNSKTSVNFFNFKPPYQVSSKLFEKQQSYASFSLLDGLVGLVGLVVGWFSQLTCSKPHKSHTCATSFHFESLYQVSTKSVKKYKSYTIFLLLGWQAGWPASMVKSLEIKKLEIQM